MNTPANHPYFQDPKEISRQNPYTGETWTRWDWDHHFMPKVPPPGPQFREWAEEMAERDSRKSVEQLLCDVHEEIHNQTRNLNENLLFAQTRIVALMAKAASDNTRSSQDMRKSVQETNQLVEEIRKSTYDSHRLNQKMTPFTVVVVIAAVIQALAASFQTYIYFHPKPPPALVTPSSPAQR